MLELINVVTGEVIGSVLTDRRMTLDELISAVEGVVITHFDDDDFSSDGDNVIVGGNRFWFEELGFRSV